MTEQFILQYIPVKVKQLGFSEYFIRYKDMTIPAGVSQIIESYRDLLFIVDDPEGLTVDSDYGMYDTTGNYLQENSHQHKGYITINNPNDEAKRIKFIQAILVK